jgi:hypothetical protein
MTSGGTRGVYDAAGNAVRGSTAPLTPFEAYPPGKGDANAGGIQADVKNRTAPPGLA